MSEIAKKLLLLLLEGPPALRDIYSIGLKTLVVVVVVSSSRSGFLIFIFKLMIKVIITTTVTIAK